MIVLRTRILPHPRRRGKTSTPLALSNPHNKSRNVSISSVPGGFTPLSRISPAQLDRRKLLVFKALIPDQTQIPVPAPAPF
jgi:hypothetical protein